MERILYEVKRVVVGQDRFLERVMVALLAQGHLLVEGVPGLAKTLTVKTLAAALRGSFKRIQFTPDLVPADLVGTRIYNQKTGEFSTSLGPVFANLLLADEINRAPAKVQSALLEVMQERQVTIAGETHKVPDAVPRDGDAEPDRDRRHLPAARGAGRPLHDEGAGRLPERGRGVRHRRARDRRAGGGVGRWPPPASSPSCSSECRKVYVDPALIQYAVKLVGATRRPERNGLADLAKYLTFGASPRATHRHDRRRARAGVAARPQLRAARRPDRPGGRRAAPPPGAVATKRWPTGSTPTRSSQRVMAKIPVPDKPLRQPEQARMADADARGRRRHATPTRCCGGSNGR